MSGPNLSEYFRNDAPSMFDEIVVPSPTVATAAASPATDTSMAAFNVETGIQRDFQTLSVHQATSGDDDIEDSVRDIWKTTQTDSNIPPLLTMPGLQSPTELADPVKAAVTYLLGETEANERKSLGISDVTQDVDGIKKLIAAGSLREATNLTFRCLTRYGQGFGKAGHVTTRHTPHSLQLWFTRFVLLIKLGEYDLCQREAEAFSLLERPDMFYDFYPNAYNNRKGSMASFAFRLLIAKLPSYFGSHKIALDRLTDCLIVCKEIKQYYGAQSNAEKAEIFWTKREQTVLYALIDCALLTKDFSLADYLMERLTKMKGIDSDTLRSLFSSWGRIYLQCGDIFSAERKFSEARRMTNTADSELRDFIDRGLIAVAQNDYREAYSFFQKSLAIDPTNALVLNNVGVCLLYLGKQKDAIGIFERAITANEQKNLSESLILNLCTLYELESSNDVSKKLALLKQLNRHSTELNINIEYCLKLPTGNK